MEKCISCSCKHFTGNWGYNCGIDPDTGNVVGRTMIDAMGNEIFDEYENKIEVKDFECHIKDN